MREKISKGLVSNEIARKNPKYLQDGARAAAIAIEQIMAEPEPERNGFCCAGIWNFFARRPNGHAAEES